MEVVYERVEGRHWRGRVPGMEGCVVQGRTIAEVRRRLVALIEGVTDDQDEGSLVEEIRIPSHAREAIERSRETRVQAEQAQEEARQAVRHAVKVLTQALDLSRRDAAELLGLSHQRIQQIDAKQKAAQSVREEDVNQPQRPASEG